MAQAQGSIGVSKPFCTFLGRDIQKTSWKVDANGKQARLHLGTAAAVSLTQGALIDSS